MSNLLKIFYFILTFCLLLSYPHYIRAAVMMPNDPYFNDQWHLSKIQAVGAWEKTTGSAEIVVAVIDTGLDLDHPDLASRLWRNTREHQNGKDDDGNGFVDDFVGWDFIDNDNDPSPDPNAPNITRAGINHGTIIAGVIGASAGNAEGVSGINWRVRIMPLRVLDGGGVGNIALVEEAIRYATAAGADVINLSFVGKTFSEFLYQAVYEAWRKNIIVVAAVGNSSSDKDLDLAPQYPACFSGPAGENIILGVAAVDREDRLANFSNFGSNCVDLTAPGVGIFSTQNVSPGNTIFREAYGGGWSGTSVAAATVSGVVALMKSFNRDLKAAEIARLVTENSEDISRFNSEKASKIGRGRLNAFLALQATEDYLLGQGRSLIQSGEILAAYSNFKKNDLRIFSKDGSWIGNLEPHKFVSRHGIVVSSGDINGDGFREIATASTGSDPRVRLWRSDGKLVEEFSAYENSFTGGVKIAFANLDGSGSEQIITAPGPGREAEVRVWKYDGTLFSHFLAFGETYTGGADIATADFDGDSHDEIVVVSKGMAEPEVKIFRPDGVLISRFLALPKNFRGGLQVATADLNGDGHIEILTMPERGYPQIRVWNYLGRELRPGFFLTPRWVRGVRLSAGDTDGDGRAEIIVSDYSSSVVVKIFDAALRLRKTFSIAPRGERGMVNLAVVR